MTGLFRENPENPMSSAEPAPSMTRLAAPQATASDDGERRERVPRAAPQTSRGVPIASTAMQTP